MEGGIGDHGFGGADGAVYLLGDLQAGRAETHVISQIRGRRAPGGRERAALDLDAADVELGIRGGGIQIDISDGVGGRDGGSGGVGDICPVRVGQGDRLRNVARGAIRVIERHKEHFTIRHRRLDVTGYRDRVAAHDISIAILSETAISIGLCGRDSHLVRLGYRT